MSIEGGRGSGDRSNSEIGGGVADHIKIGLEVGVGDLLEEDRE